MGSKERLESNNMDVTLNEVIRMQKMMIDVGEKLIHSIIENPDMIVTDVELFGANLRAYQSLGHGIQVSLSFRELCQLRGMHKPMEIQWNFVGLMRRIEE